MKILVTGSSGYLGTVLVPYLEKAGHQVDGLDTGFYLAGWLYRGVPDLPRQRLADTRSIEAEQLRGYDAIVHLAELSNDPLGQFHPQVTYAINHQGSVNLARAAKAAGVERFVYFSSCSVYGLAERDVIDERSPTNPHTPYARCKVLVEHDLNDLADDRFSPTFLRFGTAFGASPRIRFDIVLNNLAGQAHTTKAITLTSDGTPWRPLVHVLDIAEATKLTLAAPREQVHNQAFNVGETRFNYRVREIAEIVANEWPGCTLKLGKSDPDQRSYRVSFDKFAERFPEFRCRYDAQAGAAELHRLFDRIGLDESTFLARPYTRLSELKHLRATGQLDNEFFWTPSP